MNSFVVIVWQILMLLHQSGANLLNHYGAIEINHIKCKLIKDPFTLELSMAMRLVVTQNEEDDLWDTNAYQGRTKKQVQSDLEVQMMLAKFAGILLLGCASYWLTTVFLKYIEPLLSLLGQ